MQKASCALALSVNATGIRPRSRVNCALSIGPAQAVQDRSERRCRAAPSGGFPNLYYDCLPGCLPQPRLAERPAQVLGRGIAAHHSAKSRAAKNYQIYQWLTPGTQL